MWYMSSKRHTVTGYTLRAASAVGGVFVLCLGIALSVKTELGMGTFDGMSATIADVLGMKIGTFSIIINFSLIICQILIEGKSFSRLQLLQFPNVLLCGTVLNFFTYTVFGSLRIESYLLRLLISALSNVIRAAGVMMILESDIVRSAMEGLVQLVCERRNWRLGRAMMVMDAVYIAVSLSLSLIFKTPYRIREGTVIAMLMFGPCLDIIRKPVKKIKGHFGVKEEQRSAV